LPTNLLINIRF